MQTINPGFSGEKYHEDESLENTVKLPVIRQRSRTGTLERVETQENRTNTSEKLVSVDGIAEIETVKPDSPVEAKEITKEGNVPEQESHSKPEEEEKSPSQVRQDSTLAELPEASQEQPSDEMVTSEYISKEHQIIAQPTDEADTAESVVQPADGSNTEDTRVQSADEADTATTIAPMDEPGSPDNVAQQREEPDTVANKEDTQTPGSEAASTLTDNEAHITEQQTRPLLPTEPTLTPSSFVLSRKKALIFISLLFILIWNTFMSASPQFIGPQGWAYVLSGSSSTNNPNVLLNVANGLHKKTTGTKKQPTQLTPEQYINLIVQNMTLEQKLGQMMIVQFVGPTYGLDLTTMITQDDVGAVLIFAANDNIHDKNQLKSLIQQMQANSPIPLIVAIDQEGGTVDRLVNLDGPRPSATALGATNDPEKAMEAGIQDARDLSSYGINVNLAPVVDVTNVYNPQMYLRTFGTTPAQVTKMAGAYLKGLQQSGKVIGTLKHFPGLGDVSTDPHNGVPYLYRSESQLEAIDWAPYKALIAQGNVDSIMVTHEIITAIDSTEPSSLSPAIVTGILRNRLGFQGVIVTDSLTMEGIKAYHTEAEAAVLAVKAGCDLLMGATTPAIVATMIEGLKQAVNSGEISPQRIDDSVKRILMMKYKMGLLHIPTK